MVREDFREFLLRYYDNVVVEKIVDGFGDRISSIRVNRLKSSLEEIISVLEENDILFRKVSWYEDALEIFDENKVKSLDIYRDGKIYFQSLSSMLPPLFMDLYDGTSVLDMTAAPGSKTTQIASITGNKLMITALEKNKIRAERLRYNLEKQGVRKFCVLNVDARCLDNYFMFDEILLDAPCSGSGTFGNDIFLDKDLIERSVKFQMELLESACKHIVVGGSIVYSTCSVLPCENEEQIEYFLNNHSNFVLEKLNLSNYSDLPFLPSKLEGCLLIGPNEEFEGFFVSKLRRIK